MCIYQPASDERRPETLHLAFKSDLSVVDTNKWFQIRCEMLPSSPAAQLLTFSHLYKWYKLYSLDLWPLLFILNTILKG